MKLNSLQKKTKDIIANKISKKEYSLIDRLCLCGESSGNSRIIAKKDRYGIDVRTIICNKCGLVRLNPYYSESTLKRFYQSEYRKLYDGTQTTPESFFSDEIVYGERILNFVSSNSDIHFEDMTVFEIGCGAGGILVPFQKAGAKVYGCDLGKEYIEYGKKKGLVLYEGEYTVLKKHGKADLIILNHILEHIVNPIDFLKNILGLLKPDGIIYISAPGIMDHRKVYGSFMDSIQNAHIYYFSLASLKNVASKVGLKLICGNESVSAIFQKGSMDQEKIDSNEIFKFLKTSVSYATFFRLKKKIGKAFVKYALAVNKILMLIIPLKKLFAAINLQMKRYKYRNVLAKNSQYKDKYKGKRCFIIGNGPSLKDQDLTPLKNEYVFAVNNMVISEKFKQVKPNFYAMGDSWYFNQSNCMFSKNFEKLMKAKNPPILILPLIHKENISKAGIGKKLETIFYLPGRVKKIKNIDFTKVIPACTNVMNLCLYAAIFMGFSEIYILGCDMTGVITLYDEGNLHDAGHFYKETPKMKRTLNMIYKTRDNEYLLKLYGHVFEMFKKARNYANKKGVKIINLTKGGALDVFPRLKYEEVIKNI